MRNECSIIRDILPLYVEKMVSADTAAFVEEHLSSCEGCREEYERAKEPQLPRETDVIVPLVKLRKKMTRWKVQAIALTAVLVSSLFLSAFAVLDAPMYLPYDEDLISVASIGDNGLCITFDEAVTDFDYTLCEAPDGAELYYCDIQAWTSLWDRWVSRGKGKLSAKVFPDKPYPICVEYSPNDGSENIRIYGDENSGDGESSITLPRLSPGYYLIFAVAALFILTAAWFLARRNREICAWVEKIGLYPVSYLMSHWIVLRLSTTSYSLPRDFFLIIFLSLLLYSGMLLARSLWKLRKERRDCGG